MSSPGFPSLHPIACSSLEETERLQVLELEDAAVLLSCDQQLNFRYVVDFSSFDPQGFLRSR